MYYLNYVYHPSFFNFFVLRDVYLLLSLSSACLSRLRGPDTCAMACQAKSTWGESGRPGSEALPAERRENRFSDLGMRGGHLRTPWRGRHILLLSIIIIICPHMLIISGHYLYHVLVCIAASTCSHCYYVSLACADQTNNNNMRYNLPRWGVVARDAAISQRAMPQRVACDSRSGPAACKDVARAVAPRGVVRICLRCVPKSQTVPPIFRRQRLAGRPVAFAPRLLCARRPRQRFVRCCAAPRRPNMPATRAQIANHSSDSPLATLRCPAGRSRLTSALRPSPAVSRGVVARDVVISPCAAPRLLCFRRPRRRLA